MIIMIIGIKFSFRGWCR